MDDHLREILENAPEWVFKDVDNESVENFSIESGINKLISRLLVLRGIDNLSRLKEYTSDDVDLLHNPFLFKEMVPVIERIKKAVDSNEKILIFGDRDVDGVLSTAMLYNMLKFFDAKVYYKVPEGEYGYGIEEKHIDIANDEGISLIITVDTGISSRNEVKYAKKYGIDTIIIDHHLQPELLPDAYAVINPKLETETYPYKNLSGGGTVLKVIHAFILSIAKNYNKNFYVALPISEKGSLKIARVKNGIIEEILDLSPKKISIIGANSTVVKDYRHKLPEYLNEIINKNGIKLLNLVCHRDYKDIEEFASIFSKLFIKKQKKSLAFMESFIDLAAISTIADIMPLTGENRVIVKRGLKQIRRTVNLGLKTLLQYCDLINSDITAKDIAWQLAPIINSAGRMGEAEVSVELFITNDESKAKDLSRLLLEMNERRKAKGNKNYRIINPLVEEKYYKDPVIVLSTNEAEHGVTGIIASRIAKKYSKPAIVIVSDGQIGVGSGRGGKSSDLVSLISKCSDLLVKYGGHKSAVGFTISADNIEEFRERINEIAAVYKESVLGKERIEIDAVIYPEEITQDLYRALKIFEPVGVGNEPPQFSILGVSVINPSLIGRDKNHIKFYIPSKKGVLQVIGWGIGEKAKAIIERSNFVDIVFYIEENKFRNDSTLQLILQDIRPSVYN